MVVVVVVVVVAGWWLGWQDVVAVCAHRDVLSLIHPCALRAAGR
jgi:hypothetical protein